MKTEARTDPFVTPVWALYGSKDDAAIIHGVLPKYGDRMDGITHPTAMWGEGGKWTSRSQWFDTKEELIEKLGIKPACSECGKPFATESLCKPYPDLLTKANLCFSCYHWIHSSLPKYGKPGHVVVGQTTYSWDIAHPMVRLTNGGDGYGHGGRKFCIRLKSGEKVETNNLWCGGQIPERFASRMPDNAVFERTTP